MPAIIDTSNLSDEEFTNFDINQLVDMADKDEMVIEDGVAPTEEDNLDEFEPDDAEMDSDEQEELEDGSEEEDEEGDTEDEPEASEDSDEEETEDDTKVLLSDALAPIKVNGKERNIRDLAHLRSLASQGMDYSRKMQQMNQNKAIIKTLEKAKISTDDLNYLIDLKNKDPKAIAKLIEDSEVDPLDLESSEGYTPNQHGISAKAVELDEVLASIKASGSGAEFNSAVESLDAKSIEYFQDNPNGLRILNQHIQDGVYDRVMDEVAYLRDAGQLQGMPDYEAYQQVGTAMAKRGDFEPKKAKVNPLTVGGERKPAPKQKRVYKDKKQAGTVRRRSNQVMTEAQKLKLVQEASEADLPELLKKLKINID